MHPPALPVAVEVYVSSVVVFLRITVAPCTPPLSEVTFTLTLAFCVGGFMLPLRMQYWMHQQKQIGYLHILWKQYPIGLL